MWSTAASNTRGADVTPLTHSALAVFADPADLTEKAHTESPEKLLDIAYLDR
jgi:hypothetical protein